MKVPQFRSFVDKSDWQRIEPVFENNYIAEGPHAREFEKELLEIIGAKHGCFASNGTLAIYLALRGLGIGPGDEVLVQNVTFIASANAVEMVGATPVFCDIRAFNDPSIDLDRVEINERTKGMVIAPLFGTANSNIEDTVAFCKKHNLLLIEDAAQALAITNGKHVGTFGDIGTFSFYADKTITTAEGGFIVTDHDDVYEKMRYLRNQGRLRSGTFVHPEIGYNFRLTDMQAALGLSQLSKLDLIKRKKAELKAMYRERLGEHIEWLVVRDDFNHIPFRIIAFVPDAEKSIEFMKERGIEGRSMFYPLHLQPCYKFLNYAPDSMPVSNECFRRGICLPTWIGLTEEMIAHVCDALIDSLYTY